MHPKNRHRSWRVMNIGGAFYVRDYCNRRKAVQGSRRLGAGAGETVTFDQVLAVNNGELQIGCPTVAGATVTATVEKEGKAKKVIVYKYKRKTGYHKKNGHRQLYTQVKIEKINA